MLLTRRRRLPLFSALFATVVIVLVLLWDWNWFRPLVEHQASSALGRQVSLRHFDIDWSRQPLLIAEGIVIADPEGFAEGSQTGRVEALRVRVDLAGLFHGRLGLPEIEIDRADLDLHRSAQGSPNWQLPDPDDDPEKPSRFSPELGELRINDSRLHFFDPKLKSDFSLQLRTLPAKDGGENTIRADITGRYSDATIRGHVLGGSLLGLRDPASPYSMEATLVHGETQLELKGSLLQPQSLGGAKLRLSLAGADMAALFPLLGVPLPSTPPYRLVGDLDYAPGIFGFRNFKGTVGSSDLAGTFRLEPFGAQPKLTAELSSQKVLLRDLSGFLGGSPQAEGVPATAASDPDPKRLLPSAAINLPKLRAAEVDIRYAAQRIEGDRMPLDDLQAHVRLTEGEYRFEPLSFGIGEGSIRVLMRLDGRAAQPKLDADLQFRRVDVSRLMAVTGGVFKGAGTIGGRAQLKAQGPSVSALMAGGNGELQLFMHGGDLSALLVNLAGIDLGNSTLSLLGVPRRAKVRCMVSDFGLKDGLLDTRLFLIDTSEANLIGKGQLNFKDESLDWQLRTEPKRAGIGSLATPIRVGGSLSDPSVYPEPKALAGRGALAAALGLFLTPLAALLPTIQLGLGEDHDCQALVAQVQQQARQIVVAPTPP